MAASTDIVAVGNSSVFRSRVAYFGMKVAYDLLSKVAPTPAESADGKAAVIGTLPLAQMTFLTLGNSTISAEIVSGDRDGDSVPDSDIEFVMTTLAPKIGAALL